MKQLKHFKKIGWDFDGTLIGHPMSHLMWEFIILNPYQQEHHLITFRSGGMEHWIDKDFEKEGSLLRRSDFNSFKSVPHDLWLEFTRLYGPLCETDIDHPYVNWKGQTCADLGIEVFIDDMTQHVAPGCDQHGIVLFHPDDWETA